MSRSRRNGAAILDEASPAFIVIGRIFVALITLLLAIIPWSERYHTLDSFPHGQDTELNLLASFVLVGFILLFVRSAQRRIRRFLTFRPLAHSMVRPAASARFGHGLVRLDDDGPPHPGGMCNLPLQI